MKDPFLNEQGIGAVDAQSRIDMVRQFDVQQCRDAKRVPCIQKTVIKAIYTRLNKIRKDEQRR